MGEKADLEAHQRRARERERKEREDEERRREERRARRAEKDARIRQEELEMEAEAERRREERRRLRAQLETEQGADFEKSKEDRRKSYYADEEERRRQKESKSREKGREKSSRKKPSVLVEEYHESRSGSGKGIAPPANKTSSWVHSQADEPPDLPPVEGTILDPSGQKPRPADEELERKRRSRHHDKYAGMTETEIEEHRARRKGRRTEGKSASGGSDERDRRERRRRRDRDPAADGYAGYGFDEAPVKTWDGRPALGRNDSKRKSFLGGLF